MAQTRDIKFIDRDFDSIRAQLIEYSKNYFPDTYNDFSPTSPGMMFIEMASYVSDVLSFYQDIQLQESFLQYARDPKNIFNLAYTLGYRPKISSVAQTNVGVIQIIDADPGDSSRPDWSKAVRIEENMQLASSVANSPTFFVDRPVDFSFSSSFDPTLVSVEDYDINGNPNSYRLTKFVKAISGEIKTISRSFTSAERFTTITIEDTNIIGIVDIVDDSEDIWYEVPYLGQETIFKEERNTNIDNQQVYNSLSLLKVPKRFVTRFNSNGNLDIQFGSGVLSGDESEIIPSAENVGLGVNSGVSRLDYTYDPSNFLYSRTYGLAPTNTTLTIRYLVGGGTQANIPANTLTEISSITLDPSDQLANIFVTNTEAATGGSTGDSIQEIKQNSLRAFNEQGRAVTLEDYIVRCYSLPPSLGSISKVYISQDQNLSNNSTTDTIIDSNPLSLSLFVLSYDQNGNFANATSTLKENLRKYISQYIMLTDSINIKDPFIVNIGIEYDILTLPGNPGREVLLRCKNTLINYFSNSNRNINQPINLAEIILLLDRVKGVQSVENVRIVNKVGGNYSQYAYDIQGATKGNIVYPSLDPCIFEIKFPETDIKGRITTL
jgi:hypothetical protein